MKAADIVKTIDSNKSLRKSGIDTQRIKRTDIPATIKFVSKAIDVPTKDMHKLGTTSKLKTSGDIDIAISSEEYRPSLIKHRLQKLSKGQFKEHKGIGVFSYAIPIKGDPEKGMVQFDVMFTPNPEWAKFAYYAEGEGSRYKGAIRSILLSAVAKMVNKPGVDHIEYDPEDNEIVIHAGRTVDMSTGMQRIFKHRPKGKDGKRVKNSQSIPIEQFKELYPDLEIKGGQITIDDPKKVVNLLFGSTVGVDDVRTVEQILTLIRHKFDDETQDKIYRYAAKRAKPLLKKMRVPPEIEDRLQ